MIPLDPNLLGRITDMKANGTHAMGRCAVDMEVANNEDIVRARNGDLDPAKVRLMTISGVVDPGAARLVHPLAVVKELGLPIKKKKVKVRYADGCRAMRSEADEIRVVLHGRDA